MAKNSYFIILKGYGFMLPCKLTSATEISSITSMDKIFTSELDLICDSNPKPRSQLKHLSQGLFVG